MKNFSRDIDISDVPDVLLNHKRIKVYTILCMGRGCVRVQLLDFDHLCEKGCHFFLRGVGWNLELDRVTLKATYEWFLLVNDDDNDCRSWFLKGVRNHTGGFFSLQLYCFGRRDSHGSLKALLA